MNSNMENFYQNQKQATNTYIEVPTISPIISPKVEQELTREGTALATLICLTVLIREIRLLIAACK